MAEILRLGLHQTGSSLVAFAEQQGARLLLGYFLGPTAVGEFVFALRVRASIEDVLIQPFVVIVYPAFVDLRDAIAEKNEAFAQLMLGLGVMLLPAIAGAIVTAPLYVPLVFGEAWRGAVPLVQLTFVTSAALSLGFVLRDLLRAHRLIGLYFRAQTVMVVVGLGLSWLLAPRGLNAYMLGQIAIAFVSTALYMDMARRHTQTQVWRSLAGLWGALAASLVMAACLYFVMRSPWQPAAPTLALIFDIVLGAVIYAATYVALRFEEARSLLGAIRRLKQRRGGPVTPVEPDAV